MKSSLFVVAYLFLTNASSAYCTKITWTGNKDAGAVLPLSQKYWDEHNVKRPDYAKTDAEIRNERTGTHSIETEGMNGKSVLMIIGFFFCLWVYLFRTATKGSKLGTGSSKTIFSFGKPSALLNNGSTSLEEKARLARLERFEGKKAN